MVEHFDKQMTFIRNTMVVFLMLTLFFILRQLSALLIPLILAGLLIAVYLPIYERLRKWKVPGVLIALILAGFTFFVLFFVSNVIIGTIQDIISEQDYFISQFKMKIESFVRVVNETTSYDIEFNTVTTFLEKTFNGEFFGSMAKGTAVGLGSFGKYFFTFALYFLFLLFSLSGYDKYLRYVSGRHKDVEDTVRVMQKTISTYIGIKMIISLVTGSLAFVICLLFKIRFAFFWGFLTVLLNFIPSIGSIIATVPPVFMGIIQFDSFSHVFFLALALAGVQMIIGNVLDPIIMGDRLKLNAVTVLFGLVFWGYIWGIAGMLLSVPLMVILKLILEKSDTWSLVARVMGSSSGDKPRSSVFSKMREKTEQRIRKRKDLKGNSKKDRS